MSCWIYPWLLYLPTAVDDLLIDQWAEQYKDVLTVHRVDRPNYWWVDCFLNMLEAMALWFTTSGCCSVTLLWSRLKYLNIFQMDCHEILYRHSWSSDI